MLLLVFIFRATIQNVVPVWGSEALACICTRSYIKEEVMLLASYLEEETVRKDFEALVDAYDFYDDERTRQFVRRQAKNNLNRYIDAGVNIQTLVRIMDPKDVKADIIKLKVNGAEIKEEDYLQASPN